MSSLLSDDTVIELKGKLPHSRLVSKDLTIRSRHEASILKKLILRLILASSVNADKSLHQRLSHIQREIDSLDNVTQLIPQLALVERMVNTHSDTPHKTAAELDGQFQHSGETLQGVPGLPAQLKRDLRNLLQRSASDKKDSSAKVVALLQLYERALKLLSLPSNGLLASALLNIDRVNQLCNELQHLITELDFDGEVGDRLLNVRNKLLQSHNAQTLIELTLESVQLILDGTRQERKESQDFLSQLHEELSTIQQKNTHSINHTEAISAQRGALTFQIQASVDAIQFELTDTHSIESLQFNLSQIALNLSSVVKRNHVLEEREQKMLDQLRQNEQNLDILYHQTMDYRRRLGDQQRKLLLDPLTKVYNRVALDDRLEHEYRCWLRYQTPFCLAMIDIDHFKHVNDQYGHLVGDKVLKIVARTIHQCLRDTDFIARFGGEEFVVLLPDADEETRTSILNKIRETIAKLPFKFKDKRLSVTISLGASLFTEQDNTVDVLERADIALYRAKENGRNQLIWE